MRRRSISPDWTLQRRARIALARAIVVVVALVALPAVSDARHDGIDDPLTSTAQVPVTKSTPVPEPASLLLFGSGLAGLAALARRFRRRSAQLEAHR